MSDGSVKPCLVKNVLHVPDLCYQLLSVSFGTDKCQL